MQALSKAAAGKSYTIKWMFGIPEVLDKIRKCKIDEGSEITVIQNSGRDLIIRSGEKRIAMSNDAATRPPEIRSDFHKKEDVLPPRIC